MQDVPRTARVCLVIYALSKIAKGAKGSRRTLVDTDTEMYINPLAWANTTIFDYEGLLKMDWFTLYLWTYAEDTQNEEILNPLGTVLSISFKMEMLIQFCFLSLGTVVSNPNVDHATALTLTFSKFKDGKLIIYPRMDTICESAAKFRQELNEDDSLSLASLNIGDFIPIF